MFYLIILFISSSTLQIPFLKEIRELISLNLKEQKQLSLHIIRAHLGVVANELPVLFLSTYIIVKFISVWD